MKVYEVNKESLVTFVLKTKENPMATLTGLYNDAVDYRFRREDLRGYGFPNDAIDELIERGFLKEIEVDRAEGRRIGGRHRYMYDERYRNHVLAMGEYYRQLKTGKVGEYGLKLMKRRNTLYENIVLAVFGVVEEGHIVAPEILSPTDVLEAVEKHKDVLVLYESRKREMLYSRIIRDLKSLGLEIPNEKERMKRTLNDRLKKDKQYAAACRKSGKRLAAIVKEKIKTDPSILQKRKKGSAKGGETFAKRYETDPDFRKAALRRLKKNHSKGGKAKSKKYSMRREKLLTSVIVPKFGTPYDIGYTRLANYMRENEPSFVEENYGRVGSLEDALKNDIKLLRKSYPRAS